MRPQILSNLPHLLVLACVSVAPLAAQQTAPAATGEPLLTETASDTPSSLPQTAADANPTRLPGESLARIVRLSQERGVVQLDRDTGQGYETAAPNMPIVQGARLRTEEGLAEVEFEDNSSLRLTPGTEVEFQQLKLRPTGTKVSTLRVNTGSVYLSLSPAHDDELTVAFGDQTLTLAPSSHVHLFVGKPVSRLVVFTGEARVQGPSGVASATKKEILTFDSAKPSAQPLLAKGLIADSYDQWDKNEVDYQKRYAVANSFGGSPFSYGLTDLNYYGGFFNAAGCGQLWQPYFVNTAWSPYSAGLWAWYPGAGYSYVSMYPWGWTPFHSGSWSYCNGHGWGWQPTGGWSGVQNLHKLVLTGAPGGTPIKPPPPPRPRHPTSVLASNVSALPVSGLQPTGDFRFNSNSAGLGVPRGAFDNLGKISRSLGQNGSVVRSASDRVINSIAAARPTPAGAYSGVSGRPTSASTASVSRTSSSTAASSAGRSTSAPSSAGGGSHK